MNPDPYFLPEDEHLNIINFSGGRSSAFMLAHMLYRYEGHLPENTHVCFANTGVEVEPTLEFVNECSTRWGVPVTWLEYRYHPEAAGGPTDPRHRHEVVSFETASRGKEPYDAMIVAKSMLPNVAQRFCTSQLKVNPVRWWLQRELGWEDDYRNILGIRYDEPDRWGKALMEECWSEYPMVHARVKKPDVMEFWKRQPFDLGIDGDEGNCTLCFLKGRAKLVRLMRAHPEWAEWWIEKEREVTSLPGRTTRQPLKEDSVAQFSKRFTYQQLYDEAMSNVRITYTAEDQESIDCFCGD